MAVVNVEEGPFGAGSVIVVDGLQPAQPLALARDLAGISKPGAIEIGAIAGFVGRPQHDGGMIGDAAEAVLALAQDSLAADPDDMRPAALGSFGDQGLFVGGPVARPILVDGHHGRELARPVIGYADGRLDADGEEFGAFDLAQFSNQVADHQQSAASHGLGRRVAEAVETIVADDAARAHGRPVATNGDLSWSTSRSA